MAKLKVMMIGPGEKVTGGISTVVETLVPKLKDRVDLLYFPTVERRPSKDSGIISCRNIAFALSQYVRFLLALYRFRPKLVHLHTSQGIGWLKDTIYILVAKFFGTCVVLHVHAAEFEQLVGNSKIIQRYSRKVMGAADAVIAVSEEWKDRLTNIVQVNRVFAFRNCINVHAVSPHSSHFLNTRATALFLGSVGPRKGAFDLLEAMDRLKAKSIPLQALIAGYEETKGDLLRASARQEELHLGNFYQLLGTVRGVQKSELLSKASMFVLPSYNEGLPMALLEAMAAGLPIVATSVGGIPEVVKDGYNGFLVEAGNVVALAEKLAVLSCDRQLCELMGQRSREIAERELDVLPYVERLIALYESITI